MRERARERGSEREREGEQYTRDRSILVEGL